MRYSPAEQRLINHYPMLYNYLAIAAFERGDNGPAEAALRRALAALAKGKPRCTPEWEELLNFEETS